MTELKPGDKVWMEVRVVFVSDGVATVELPLHNGSFDGVCALVPVDLLLNRQAEEDKRIAAGAEQLGRSATYPD